MLKYQKSSTSSGIKIKDIIIMPESIEIITDT
jgi:hypothetical protein